MSTYDVEEAAEYCKCHPETIREHIREGRLNASKPGRKYCITQSALDAFLSEQENAQLQTSLKSRSEEKCRFTNETMAYGTLTSQRQVAAELDNLLAPKSGKKPKSCMTN
ncbi:helix-turn-helix domain-containing protein [Neisseria dentiae]|uniref:helix-turn-helix domain-containing protein n=1 Tax=Neisseria dentiae TaxID=194197 RepID=UPI00211BD14C|nr:helix-turn-helix domain-containing protein [Neisseria dentiae]